MPRKTAIGKTMWPSGPGGQDFLHLAWLAGARATATGSHYHKSDVITVGFPCHTTWICWQCQSLADDFLSDHPHRSQVDWHDKRNVNHVANRCANLKPNKQRRGRCKKCFQFHQEKWQVKLLPNFHEGPSRQWIDSPQSYHSPKIVSQNMCPYMSYLQYIWHIPI